MAGGRAATTGGHTPDLQKEKGKAKVKS
jgi:hypothetical protein